MIIALTNAKGGVAKTTTCINLGHALSIKKKKVLIVDLDFQGSCSLSLGINREDSTTGTGDVILDGIPIEETIVPTAIKGLDLLPYSDSLASFDLLAAEKDEDHNLLSQALEPIKSNYDFILIDTPPTFSLLLVNVILACDSYLVPVNPDFLSLQGLRTFLDAVDRIRGGYGAKCEMLGILLTAVDRRMGITKECINLLKETFNEQVLKTEIGINSKLKESPSFQKSIFQYSPSAPGAIAYQRLGDEILKRAEKSKCLN